jgi:hypothetical protein
VFDQPVPVGMTDNGHYYCTLSQGDHKQPELLEHGVILLHDSATPHCHHDVQNLVQHWSWEVLVHSPYSPDLVPFLKKFFKTLICMKF